MSSRVQGGTAADRERLLQEAEEALLAPRKLFERIAEDLRGQEYWRSEEPTLHTAAHLIIFFRFSPAFSPGMQEYLEAASFLEYVRSGSLLSLEQAERDIKKAFTDAEVHRVCSASIYTITNPSTLSLQRRSL